VYGDVVAEVRAELLAATEAALAAGVRREQVVWDVGLGFAKSTDQNLALLRGLRGLTNPDQTPHTDATLHTDVTLHTPSNPHNHPAQHPAPYPLLLGPSRKRFIGAVLDEPRPRARLWGTAAVCALAVAGGARVLRVHDVGPIAQVTRMAQALC